MIDAKGESTTYTYDNAGRLTAKHFVTAPLQDVAYTYDDSSASNFGKGKLTHLSDASGSTALTWTRRGDLASLSSAIGSQTYTTSFSYDLGGRISTITYPSGREVSFTRDAQGQVTAVATRADAAAASSAVLQSIAWQPYGPFSVATLSSGLTLDHGFSLDQELTSITLFDGATSLLHRTFSRSDLINITGIDDPVNAGNQTFAYTPSNRLSIATGEWGSESYSYDPAGNRLSLEKIVNGTATTMSYAYSPLTNRLSSVSLNGEPSRTFTHDAAGNIIEDVRGGHVYGYSYDAAGHLASVTKDGLLWASYLYNSFDQLASRELTAATATPATSHYLYDAQGHLIAEADGSSGAILREYIWLDDMPIAVIDTVADGAPLYHVITDHLYRPIAMYDSTGTQVWSAVWEPFGALHSVSGALALDARFPGQWYQLETGLHYNWHRHYDPTLGRYTQPDPLGLEAGANRFTYALGNPIMNIDPDGLKLKGGAHLTNCKGSPFVRGKDVHDLFRRLAEASSEVPLQFDKGPYSLFGGRVDAYAPTTGDVWELKPTTYGDGWLYRYASNQVSSYINSASQSVLARPGRWSVLFPDMPIATIRDPYYGTVTFEPDDPSNTGLIFYSCEPPPPVCYPQ
jgi:RHS repeat-associated protein